MAAARIELPLFALSLATIPLGNSSLAVLTILLSLPQFPGMWVAERFESWFVHRFGSAADGIPPSLGLVLFFGLVLLIQLALLTAIISAWRAASCRLQARNGA